MSPNEPSRRAIPAATKIPLVVIGEPFQRPCDQTVVVFLRKPEWQQATLMTNGMFSVTSAWGNYAYSWNGFGDDFVGWFCGIDGSYLLSKVNPGNVFDRETSERMARNLVRDLRRDNTITPGQARALRKDVDIGSESEAVDWFSKTHATADYSESVRVSDHTDWNAVPVASMPNPQAAAYCRKGLPALQRALRRARKEGKI